MGMGERLAPGLNEKFGSAGDPGERFSLLLLAPKGRSCVSIADRGRRPVARETEDGADTDAGLAGKTKCGFGGGS